MRWKNDKNRTVTMSHVPNGASLNLGNIENARTRLHFFSV